MNYLLNPGGHINGVFQVPGDKSISHRALILSAIANGTSEINGFLESADTHATLNALQSLGVRIERKSAENLLIYGVGQFGLINKSGSQKIDLGNSGTSMRLLAGLLSAQNFETILVGDDSLHKRPMKRIVEPLIQMRANIKCVENNFAPLHVFPAISSLKAIQYTLPVASAQIKSCLLLVSLYAEGTSFITEKIESRDHTERMLEVFNYPIQKKDLIITIAGKHALQATTLSIQGDLSSAAFFIVGACITPHSNITIQQVGINPKRTGMITLLKRMGANIEIQNQFAKSNEPRADITVQYSPLKGIEISPEEVVSAIDEFPAIFIAAACAEGKTILTGAQELRVKESDRINAMAEGLKILGISVEEKADGIVIHGGKILGGKIDCRKDHRVAMAFAIAALRAQSSIEIIGCENVATSFPNFVSLAKNLGLKICGQ